jgi:peptidoglycan hydrolase-like protein with peptidoglycan-binding domain
MIMKILPAGIALGIFCILASSANAQSASEIARYGDSRLCRAATDGVFTKKWSSGYGARNAVLEAKRRGLSCGVVRAGSSSSQSQVFRLSDTSLCYLATTRGASGSRIWNTNLPFRTTEAKSRGLSCGVAGASGRAIAPSSSSSNSQSQDAPLGDASLCYLATTRGASGSPIWNTNLPSRITEAKSRGLSCGVASAEKQEKEAAERRRQQEADRRNEEESRRREAQAKADQEARQRQLAEDRRREAEAQRLVQLHRSVQQALKTLGFYDGAPDGLMGPGTRRGLGTWLSSRGMSADTKIDEELIVNLHAAVEDHRLQLARAEEQRKEEEARQARVEEERRRKLAEDARRRKLNAPDYKQFVELKPRAESLIAQVKEFISSNPTDRVLIPASRAMLQVVEALKTESGKQIVEPLSNLEEVVSNSDSFVAFKVALAQADERDARSRDAQVIRELNAYRDTLAQLLASGRVELSTLLPLLELNDLGLTAGSATARAAALTELKAKVAQNETVSEAAAGIEKEVAERRVAARKEQNQDAVAVIIGNKDYKNGVPEVTFAHNDADAVKDYVINTLGYSERNIIDLRDTSQTDLIGMFGSDSNHRGKLFGRIRPGRSDVVVFYSGHGVPGLQDKRGYLLPVDADPDLAELNGYPIDRLFANLAKLDARSVLVMLDACFSGDSHGGVLLEAASGISVKVRPAEGTGGMTVLTAASGDQLASWDKDAKHGLFTQHLLQGLAGTADGGRYGNGDGNVTLGELKTYLDDEMTYQARRRFSRDQRATVQGDPNKVIATQN